jgi:hypothetical protein
MIDPKLDSHYVHMMLQRLSTPFKDWPAYQMGIIDIKGNILKERDELSDEQLKNWTLLDLLACNLRRDLYKVAGAKQKLSSMQMALSYLKQTTTKAASSEVGLKRQQGQLFKFTKYNPVKEDIANAVGGGNVAGLGVGPQGEPPVSKAALIKRSILNKKKKNNGETK